MPPSADDDDTTGVEVTPMMSVRGGPGGLIHQPIHESLTLAALINGNFGVASGTTVDNASNHDWEYIRGAVWNDDPSCLLFDRSSEYNHKYALGSAWCIAYTKGASEWSDFDSRRLKNPTGRSHYGDLQFLHCMASESKEPAAETKRKVMAWLEVMYKLANGEDGITAQTKPTDTKLKEFCPVGSLPPSWETFSYYLSANSGFEGLDIGRRALGSMFHIIQDSYAIGHTRRTPLNREDRISENPLVYKSGTTDRWGAIENFHTYGGQDENLHSHYDHPNDKLPDPGNLGDLSQFDGLIGCRMAVEKCQGLLKLKQAGTKWKEGVEAYLDGDVFALSPTASPANNEV
ncbi:hypothetical protein AK830_g3276 [Neonectria ditissima]|uniref:Uncharacterized protein n=1 Tax=Neonectria ditissima TaxID=78410 RepID=A0A0P7BIE1_9HYPO|nr:hypothetical protein AK830_g3276 [Neonectria ditissima]